MNRYDLLIIGAGVSGAAIARELSRYRLRIALLERHEEPAFGVSKSNSGIIHPGTQIRPGLCKGELCVQGNRMMRSLARELGVDFKQVGELIVAFSPNDVRCLRQIRDDALKLRVPGVRIVGRGWLRRHESNLNPDALAALYAPTAGVLSPYRLVYDLCENAMRNGVSVHTLTCVKNITRTGSDYLVHTSRGDFYAPFVVNAAGLFADDIARMARITDITIHPRKGQEFLLDKKKRNLTRHLVFPLPSKVSKGVIVIKTSDGNPMIGPTAEDTADKSDLTTTDAGFAQVLAAAQRLVPSVQGGDVIAYFAGVRPAAGEDFIIRAEKSAPGMVTVAGIQSPGLTAAPAIACKVVRLLKESGLTLCKKRVFMAHRHKSVHLFALGFRRARSLIRKEPGYGDIVCRCEMVSAREVRDAIARGATTLDGIKFRTRAQAGRCHGSFCTSRLLRILAQERDQPVTAITKRGQGSEIVSEDRHAAA
jgi:glycerol-3-phosphate dehydrogenase